MMPGTPFDLRPIVPPLGAESDRFASGRRSDLLFSFTDSLYLICVEGRGKEQGVRIIMAALITPPVTSHTVVGDFAKQPKPAEPPRYAGDVNGAYGSAGAPTDFLTGVGDSDEYSGGLDHEAMSGGDGKDFSVPATRVACSDYPYDMRATAC